MQRFLLTLILFASLASGCEKEDNNDTSNVQGDHQIRFPLPENITYDTLYHLTDKIANIDKFNIDYYTGVDSIFYAFYSFVQNGSSGTVELYNFTDSMPITGSLIHVVSNETGAFYQSGNLFKSFPHKEIMFGVRIKGSVQGNYVNAVSGYLYLYRK